MMDRQELIEEIEDLLDIDCTPLYHTSELKYEDEKEFFRALLNLVDKYKTLKMSGQ